MSIQDDFLKASQEVKTLSKTPSNETMLELYGLYKQGTEGDVAGARPGMLQMVKRAKFDAWATKKGLSKETAQEKYISQVRALLAGDK